MLLQILVDLSGFSMARAVLRASFEEEVAVTIRSR
jgi:hypothetical protein